MEQRSKSTPTTSPAPRPASNSIKQYRFRSSTPSPSSITPSASSSSISLSEPTLRFPRPLGSCHLANWITASDPGIMHTTATEDTGLTESTYELVGSTDTESQDGNYTESMSESLGSLDFHRPDDVVSLAGTDQTFDDESVADLAESQNLTASNVNLQESLQTAVLHGDESSDDEKASQSSLDYADNSLQAPSMTPEASAIIGNTAGETQTWAKIWRTNIDRFWIMEDRVQVLVIDAVSKAIPGLIFVALAAAFLPVLFSGNDTSSSHPFSTQSPINRTTSTVVATTSNSKTTAKIALPTTGVGLIPLGNGDSDEWLFSARRASISFTPQGKHDVLVHVQEAARDAWFAKGCVSVTATRDDATVQMKSGPVPDGILLQFPRKEAYGVVIVSVKATCRPRARGQVKVHFGKGIMVEAFEKTKHLAQDISGFVPVAAQEAERRLADASRSLHDASHSVSESLGSLANTWFTILLHNVDKARASLQYQLANFTESHGTLSDQVFILKKQAQLLLLDSQLKARVLWLRAQGQVDEYKRYLRAARDHLANEQKLADAAIKQRKNANTESPVRSWYRLFA